MTGQILSRMRLPFRILQTHLLQKEKPLVVLLYLTDRCNLKCQYCVGHWSGRKIPDPTLVDVKSWIDQFVKMGTCHITVHGGEILLREDVGEIIDYMKFKGLYVNLVTNGILFPEKHKEIKNVDSLCISLDGRETANDANRGKGSHKKILAAIDTALQEGFNLSVHSTLTSNNYGEIEWLAQRAKKYGYSQQFSLLLKPFSECNQMVALSDSDIRKVLERILKLKKEGYPIFTSEGNLKNALKWPFPYEKAILGKAESAAHPELIPCYYGKLKVTVDTSGNVIPCAVLNNSFPAKNIRDVGFKKAYQHVIENRPCDRCYFLTSADWSLLLGLSPKMYWEQIKIQLKQIITR